MSTFKTLLVLTALFALSGCNVTEVNAQPRSPQIDVTGNAEISVKPDMAQIHLSLQTRATDSAAAKRDSDRKLNAFLDALDDLGIGDDQIQAGTLNLSAQYDYQDRTQRFIGFQANRSIQVEVSDLDLLHPLLDTAINAGVNSIDSIQYASSNEAEVRQQARAAAIEDSKQKAEQLAEAYDARLGAIYHISYQAPSPPVPFKARAESMVAMSADSGGGRFIPGDLTFSDQISVTFNLITGQ